MHNGLYQPTSNTHLTQNQCKMMNYDTKLNNIFLSFLALLSPRKLVAIVT